MNTLDKQAYFAFIDKWFRINPESVIAFEKEEVEDEVVVKTDEQKEVCDQPVDQ